MNSDASRPEASESTSLPLLSAALRLHPADDVG